jgi:flagellar assembly protein FliH
MTSLFDHAQARSVGQLPVDLIPTGGRGVAPLDFFVIGGAALEPEEAGYLAGPTPESVANDPAQQVQAMIDAARADAIVEARLGFEQELAARLRAERARVERACAEFAMDRQRFFAAAEAQVVKLALAIARRVLAREVDADAIHLAATVRAALARVHDATASVLRVPPEEAVQWSAIFADVRAASMCCWCSIR